MFSPFDIGLSAQSIQSGSGKDYPRDPADLQRCIRFCRHRYTTEELRQRMASKSVEWDRLTAEWDNLVALLHEEMETGDGRTAPRTYMEMKRVLAAGVACPDCYSTGRGSECLKCKGTGKRGGGRCRAERCYRGADYCPTCHGRGYTTNTKAA